MPSSHRMTDWRRRSVGRHLREAPKTLERLGSPTSREALDLLAFQQSVSGHHYLHRSIFIRHLDTLFCRQSAAPAPRPQSAPLFSSQSCSSNLSRLVTESRKAVDQPNRISPLPASMAPNSRQLPSSTTSP